MDIHTDLAEAEGLLAVPIRIERIYFGQFLHTSECHLQHRRPAIVVGTHRQPNISFVITGYDCTLEKGGHHGLEKPSNHFQRSENTHLVVDDIGPTLLIFAGNATCILTMEAFLIGIVHANEAVEPSLRSLGGELMGQLSAGDIVLE